MHETIIRQPNQTKMSLTNCTLCYLCGKKCLFKVSDLITMSMSLLKEGKNTSSSS